MDNDENRLHERERKIDLNNANVRQFIDFRGMYPTLARLVVSHAPYKSVEDVLNIPNLSDREKQCLTSYLDRFIVTPPKTNWSPEDDRFNRDIYS